MTPGPSPASEFMTPLQSLIASGTKLWLDSVDPDEIARNRALVPIRSAVERVFGTLKRSYGWVRVRYRGLARNAHLELLCLALNLRRLDALTR